MIIVGFVVVFVCVCIIRVLFLQCDHSMFVGEKGIGKSTGKPLHYKGSQFHRIIKGFMAQVCFFLIGDLFASSLIVTVGPCLHKRCNLRLLYTFVY